MSDLIWLSEAQMARIALYFPLSHGVPRVDDRRITNGIIFVLGNGLRRHDASAKCEPAKTIYNRFIRWSRMGTDWKQGHESVGIVGLKDKAEPCWAFRRPVDASYAAAL